MIEVVFPIIFWFPHMCHLSVQLQSSAGRTIWPDCGRQKGISHHQFAAVSQSHRCHGADVTEAWFFSLQREKDTEEDREYQRWLIIYSDMQVDACDTETTCQSLGRVTPESFTRPL